MLKMMKAVGKLIDRWWVNRRSSSWLPFNFRVKNWKIHFTSNHSLKRQQQLALSTLSCSPTTFQDNRQQRLVSVGQKGIHTSKEGEQDSNKNEAMAAGDLDGAAAREKDTPTGHNVANSALFDLTRSGDSVSTLVPLRAFKDAGLWRTDPRLADTIRKLNRITTLAKENGQDEARLNADAFEEFVVKDNPGLLRQALTGDLAIPEFSKFTKVIDDIFAQCRSNNDGQVASYIPQLAQYRPDYWGVSVCTVDGQRHAVGDAGVPFTLQSSGKPFNYALAINELGPEDVHRYVGHEPSGESFNCIKLSPENKPHNPMVNAGAIVVASLLRRDLSPADRFDHVMTQYRRVVGGEYLGFNNAVYLSEKATASRNFALAYYLKENRCFPEGSSLADTLDLYFQLCSVEVNANSAAVMASTLANGGTCPITGDQVLSPTSVRNTLALMHSCGMYDYSGEFAFKVGLPAKSSVSGAVVVVIPNVLGLCLWSPPLDRTGNSVRGVQFCNDLLQRFQFHPYECVPNGSSAHETKADPRQRKSDVDANRVVGLLFGAYNGDLTALRRMALAGSDTMTAADYDGRTALHVAAAEGHVDCVRFLVEVCKVPVDALDRWGGTPLDDAIKFDRESVRRYLELFA